MKNGSILFISRCVQGGIKTHLEILIDGLVKENYQVSLVTPINNLDLPQKVKIHLLPIPELPYNKTFLLSVSYLKHLIQTQTYSIIHTHGYAAGLTGRLAAILAGKKKVIHTVHNFFPSVSPVLSYGGKLTEVWLSHHTKKIIAVSDQLRNAEIKMGISSDKVVTVYNGIDIAKFKMQDKYKARSFLGLSMNEPVVGTISRLIPSKGIDIFLEALALQNKERPLKGLIIGDGPERPALQNLAQKLNLSDKVLFLGHRTDIPMLLSALDVFILPSRQEGFGLVLPESLCLGLPVIASSTGGITEIIESGSNGLLFAPGNIEELSRHISTLMYNEKLRDKLVKNGIESVNKKFSSEQMVKSTLFLYQEFLK